MSRHDNGGAEAKHHIPVRCSDIENRSARQRLPDRSELSRADLRYNQLVNVVYRLPARPRDGDSGTPLCRRDERVKTRLRRISRNGIGAGPYK